MTIPVYPPRNPGAILTCGFDFNPELTVRSDDFPTFIGCTSNAVNILAVDSGGNAGSALIGGGTPGTTATIVWTATTNNGLSLEDCALLPIASPPPDSWGPPSKIYLS